MEDVQAGVGLLLEKVGGLLGSKGLLTLLSKFVIPTRSVGIELFPEDAGEAPVALSADAIDEIAANLPADLTPEESRALTAAMDWLRTSASGATPPAS